MRRVDHPLDELARSLAQPVPRRSAFRLLGGALVAAGVSGLVPSRARAQAADDPCPTCSDRPNTQPCCVRLSDTTARVAVGQCYYPGTEQCCTGPSAYDGRPTCWICQKWEKCGQDGADLCIGCPDGRDPCKDECCKDDEQCIDDECKKRCENEHSRGASRMYNPKTQCCTDYGIERKYPIRYFERCRKTRVPRAGFKPTSNGCGPAGGPKVPDKFGKASFLKACNKHDICYGTCKSDRKACDKKFGQRLRAACRGAYGKGTTGRARCLERADEYHDLVTALGSVAYDDAQSEACQCCP